jgi:hypothetical protein
MFLIKCLYVINFNFLIYLTGRKRASKWDVPAPDAIASSSKTHSSSSSSRHVRRGSRDRDRERDRNRERDRDRDRRDSKRSKV